MKSLTMTTELYQYILNANPIEQSSLGELRQKTDQLKYARLRSPTEQIHFITFLLKLLQPSHILEIGTFTGYATLAMALATPETTKIITCDINNVFPQTGQSTWKKANVAKRIDLRLGPALETLKQLKQKSASFDFVFIDADKENYWHYFKIVLSLLSNKGIILVDNVLWHGQVADKTFNDTRTRAIRDFNTRLTQQNDIYHCLLPIGDGLTLIAKQ